MWLGFWGEKKTHTHKVRKVCFRLDILTECILLVLPFNLFLVLNHSLSTLFLGLFLNDHKTIQMEKCTEQILHWKHILSNYFPFRCAFFLVRVPVRRQFWLQCKMRKRKIRIAPFARGIKTYWNSASCCKLVASINSIINNFMGGGNLTTTQYFYMLINKNPNRI